MTKIRHIAIAWSMIVGIFILSLTFDFYLELNYNAMHSIQEKIEKCLRKQIPWWYINIYLLSTWFHEISKYPESICRDVNRQYVASLKSNFSVEILCIQQFTIKGSRARYPIIWRWAAQRLGLLLACAPHHRQQQQPSSGSNKPGTLSW